MEKMENEFIDSKGQYCIYKGKLSHDDSRNFYGTGPTDTDASFEAGRIVPIASFWNESDARQWLKSK